MRPGAPKPGDARRNYAPEWSVRFRGKKSTVSSTSSVADRRVLFHPAAVREAAEGYTQNGEDIAHCRRDHCKAASGSSCLDIPGQLDTYLYLETEEADPPVRNVE